MRTNTSTPSETPPRLSRVMHRTDRFPVPCTSHESEGICASLTTLVKPFLIHRADTIPAVVLRDVLSGRSPHRLPPFGIAKENDDLFGDLCRILVRVEQESGRLILTQ